MQYSKCLLKENNLILQINVYTPTNTSHGSGVHPLFVKEKSSSFRGPCHHTAIHCDVFVREKPRVVVWLKWDGEIRLKLSRTAPVPRRTPNGEGRHRGREVREKSGLPSRTLQDFLGGRVEDLGSYAMRIFTGAGRISSFPLWGAGFSRLARLRCCRWCRRWAGPPPTRRPLQPLLQEVVAAAAPMERSWSPRS